MNAPEHPQALLPGRARFNAPLAGCDDAALLAHFRAPRAVRYYPVADPEETLPERIEAIMQGRFEFNGESHALGEPPDWLDNPSRDIEWHILLHKFYYAVGLGMAYVQSGEARYAARWQALLESWMAVTPPGFIAADVTGRRVQNWIYSYHHFVTHAPRCDIDPAFHRRLLESLHEQVDYLCEHLTPARNHRTLELYSIFLASVVFPEFERARHWQAFALERIVDNMATDLLPDGVQIELSTDYHQLVLKNYLNVRRLAAMNGIAVPPAMDEALARALEFSLHVHKPDGIVPSLSDGDARSFLDLLAAGAELYGREDFRYVASGGRAGTPPRERVRHFADSGYTVVRSHWGTGGQRFADAHYLIFDCGPLGAGNHGHFDCLSFELAAFGRSLVVDPGRYTYSEAGETNWRVRFRSTEAHNTVCVDGLNQTLYVPRPIKEPSRHAHGSVRHKVAGPAPDAQLHEQVVRDDLVLLSGSARSHAYDARHHRRILFVDGSYWIISDWLESKARHHYALRFQLGEAAQGEVEQARGAAPLIRSPGLLMAQPADGAVRFALEPSWVSYRYGEKLAAPRLCFSTVGECAAFDSVLVPFEGRSPPLAVSRLTVSGGDREAGQRAAALAIEGRLGGMAFRDLWFHARDDRAGEWEFDGYRFSGRWLWLREDGEGRITRLHASQGARLAYRGLEVALRD